MIFRGVACLAALAFAAPLLAAPAGRAPTGNWNVNFGDAQCVAQREYGTPANPLLLVLKAPAKGEVMQLAAVRAAPSAAAQQVDSTVAVDGGPPLETQLLMYSMKGSRNRVYLLNMPSSKFEAVRRAQTLSVRSSSLNETFALSQMEPLLKVMEECVADLRRMFNIGPADTEPAALASRAKANIASFFSDKDYPAVAIVNNQGGRVRFALLISEDGRVADCTIVETSGVPSLDSQACAVLKVRSRFEPALSLDGKPARDSYIGSIVWRMP